MDAQDLADENANRGPRGFRGPTGPLGPTGPCCTGATGPGTDIVPTFFPVSKPLGATFYGSGPGVVEGGGIFDFPLDGPNDPIGRADSGTFVLPFAGLYKVAWQMPILEGAEIGFGAVNVQSTLTAQTVEEGSFVPVAGGVSDRGAPMAQLVGETIVDATRNNYPIRIENTSRGPTGAASPVNYYSPIPTSPSQRTINIASLVPQRLDAHAHLENRVSEVVPTNGDVTFSHGNFVVGPTGPNGGLSGATGPTGAAGTASVNVGVTPSSPPYTGFVIQLAGRYVINWNVMATSPGSPGGFASFVPFVNGIQLPISSPGGGPASGQQISGVLNVGDVVTLRNISGAPATLSNTFPNAYFGIYSYNSP